jgi:DNA topoisomerase VI subunit B
MVRITLGAMSTLEDVDKIANVFESVLVNQEIRALSMLMADEVDAKIKNREKLIEALGKVKSVAGTTDHLSRIGRGWRSIVDFLSTITHELRL